jgi:hypothetical protein
MLFLASKVFDLELSKDERLGLLERLQERGFIPLIRSSRLSCYEHALAGAEQVREMEQAIAAHINSAGHDAYTGGDIFCFQDHVIFLLFGELETGSTGMRAGIVYEQQTLEPIRKLDSFCQTVSLCVAGAERHEYADADESLTKLTRWRQERTSDSKGFMRFVAKQDVDTLSTIVCKENAVERVRASELLEDDYTRLFLQRAKEAYAEGFPVNPSADETSAPSEYTVNKLAESGLLRREVLVSCRKTGHTLFSLPSADALAVITISNAHCSECGAAIADEKIEEVVAPTPLASILLEDGAWLVNRLHAIIRGLGIPESEIAIEPPTGEGEARLLARVCGVSFLIVMRDGDLTPAFARRAINTKIETESRHLVIIVTGTVHKESRINLQGFAKRLLRGGNDFELIIAEGVGAVAAELRDAFERASRQALTEQLCELDSDFGMDVAHFIATRFQILHDARHADLPARLPANIESAQGLQKTSHTTSIIDLNIFGINEPEESSLTPPHQSS